MSEDSLLEKNLTKLLPDGAAETALRAALANAWQHGYDTGIGIGFASAVTGAQAPDNINPYARKEHTE